jgi:hypothetical protein
MGIRWVGTAAFGSNHENLRFIGRGAGFDCQLEEDPQE